MRDIDFSQLTLKDALDLAILVEEEAEAGYRRFLAEVDPNRTSGAARFFRFMAVREAEHGHRLQRRRERLFGDEPSEVDRAMLYDVEIPTVNGERRAMPVRRALELALEAESDAYSFFDRALPLITDEEVRALFRELRSEEVEHRDVVRRVMRAVENDPAFRIEEVVSGVPDEG